MKKRYNFNLEEKVVEQLDAVVKASKSAGHIVSKSELVEIAIFQLIKGIVAHSQKEAKKEEK